MLHIALRILHESHTIFLTFLHPPHVSSLAAPESISDDTHVPPMKTSVLQVRMLTLRENTQVCLSNLYGRDSESIKRSMGMEDVCGERTHPHLQ